MPRGPQPPWPVVKRTLELAVLHGRANVTAIQRSLAIELQESDVKYGLPTGYVPDTRTIGWITTDYMNGLSPEAVIEQLPPSVWALRQDHEALKEAAAANRPGGRVAFDGKAAHRDKMVQMSAKLESQILLPRILDCLLDPLRPGGYFLGENMLPIRIGEDQRVRVELQIEGAGTPEAHLYQGLRSHLRTGAYSAVLPDLDRWKMDLALHLEQCHRLLLLVRKGIEDLRIPGSSGELPGATEWFSLLLCGDAVTQATGDTWIADSWYKHDGKNLTCGPYVIYQASSSADLQAAETLHKQLRTSYVDDSQVRSGAGQRKAITKTIEEVVSMLRRFRDGERLPGQCELCS